jgi:hypothetical protein
MILRHMLQLIKILLPVKINKVLMNKVNLKTNKSIRFIIIN